MLVGVPLGVVFIDIVSPAFHVTVVPVILALVAELLIVAVSPVVEPFFINVNVQDLPVPGASLR